MDDRLGACKGGRRRTYGAQGALVLDALRLGLSYEFVLTPAGQDEHQRLRDIGLPYLRRAEPVLLRGGAPWDYGPEA